MMTQKEALKYNSLLAAARPIIVHDDGRVEGPITRADKEAMSHILTACVPQAQHQLLVEAAATGVEAPAYGNITTGSDTINNEPWSQANSFAIERRAWALALDQLRAYAEARNRASRDAFEAARTAAAQGTLLCVVVP